MPSQSQDSPNYHALLIGVDCYLPNRLPDGSYYPNLGGCVRDVNLVEAFLRRTLDPPAANIIKLTATDAGTAEPSEPRAQWPTYENMVAAFQHITKTAGGGDHVYVHYCGHGGRAKTVFPELKGANGLDEGLVPTDIGDSEARYLRDIELAGLLSAMVEKGLVVTVVLDCCHSGGMTRGVSRARARGIRSIDSTARPPESLAGDRDALIAVWNRLTGGKTRNLKLGAGILPEPKGYVLLSACRPSEEAFEDYFDGVESNGALTYWLLDSLKDLGPGLSYKTLHDRIVAKVHGHFETQTPQLQGEGDREVFGGGGVETHYAVTVMAVEKADNRILLNAGQAQGLGKGAQFAVFARGAADFSDASKRLALAEIVELGATDSRAAIKARFGPAEIEQGAQAVLVGAGSLKLVRNVSLVQRDDLPDGIEQQDALDAVRKAIEGSGWIEVSSDGKGVAFQVAVNEKSEFEIWDAAGKTIGNLRPAIAIGERGAASKLAARLAHLAKFQSIKQLQNHDPLSPLARKLTVELVGKMTEYDPADPFEPEAFDDPGNTPALRPGEWTGLRIRNDSSRVLNVTVFDLQPDWGVSQVYPSGEGDYFVAFDPGQELVIPLRADLPAGYDQGADTLKVFATVGTTSFRWLELPALDRPRRSSTRGAAPADPLEELLAAVSADRPPMRNLTPAAYPSKEWITAQVEVRVKRS